jgi:predicted ATP-grasp superfamily ATP-dependent carboligase
VRQGPLHFARAPSSRFAGAGGGRPRARILAAAGYRGFAHVEFAHDAREGASTLPRGENTRLPSGRDRHDEALRHRALAYDDTRRRGPEGPRRARRGRNVDLPREGTVRPAQMARRRRARVRSFLAPYVRRGKVRATFAADDPRPAIASIGYLRSRVG